MKYIVRLKVRFYPGEVFRNLLSEMEIETESDDDDDTPADSGGSSSGSTDAGGSDDGGDGGETMT